MSFLQERLGAVHLVRLAWPRNSLNPESCDLLGGALEAAAHDPAVRCVLLEAEGPTFCVGADLAYAADDPAARLAPLVRAYHRASRAILTMPKPVVVAVQGSAAGGGFSLAMAGDVRMASPQAKFRLAYPQVGLPPDGGATLTVPPPLLQRLLFEDPVLTAEEALREGLVHAVVPDLPAAGRRRAAELAEGPTRAWGESKALLRPHHVVDDVLEREAHGIARFAATADCAEGIRAFLQKRRPRFQGA